MRNGRRRSSGWSIASPRRPKRHDRLRTLVRVPADLTGLDRHDRHPDRDRGPGNHTLARTAPDRNLEDAVAGAVPAPGAALRPGGTPLALGANGPHGGAGRASLGFGGTL